MNICVFGLWHLGCVTAACLARKGFNVTGLDFEKENVLALKEGKAPVYEPGLNKLLCEGIKNEKLNFSTDPVTALKNIDILWVTFDTPVDEEDRAHVEFVKNNFISIMNSIQNGTKIIISSQVPVGFTYEMKLLYEKQYPGASVKFAY